MERSNLKNYFSRLKLLPLLLVPMVAFGVTKWDSGIFTSSLKIGGTAAPASNVAFDVTSTTKGVLFPRMTNVQKAAIAAPPTGLIVYSTNDNSYEYWDGAAWSLIGGGVAPVTASRALVSDGSGLVSAATTTATEIGYVNGVTSAIQTQLNLKAPAANPTFTGTTTFSGLTATTVPYLDGSKALVSSAVTPTELGYVSGVSSAIQTQFTGKASTTLNNLGTTAINAALLASAANSWDIGSAANYFKNGYGLTWQTNTDSGAFILNPADTATTARFKYESSSYTLSSRQSDTGAGRRLTILTDDVAGANANATGAIAITTGAKTAGTGDSGKVEITTGTSVGGGRGRVNILDGTDGYAGMVWTSNNNAGGGHWMKPTGEINFIANPDAEYPNAGTAGVPAWATYADAAAATPVDGTGGAPTVTWTRSTSSPLAGAASFLFTKDAANRQGNGASYDFTIQSAHKAKVMQVEFDYQIASGTFVAGSSSVDSDIEVYIYDLTNAVIIQPSTYKLFSSATSPPSHFVTNFQTASNSTSYRLILHTATTSASAYTVQFDNVEVVPAKYTYGTPITDWTAYTPVCSWTANTTPTGFWRRVGSDIEVKVKAAVSGGVPTSATLTFNLPVGLTIDTTRMVDALNSFTDLGGAGSTNDSSTSAYKLFASYNNTTSVMARYQSNASGLSAAVTQAAPIAYNTGDSAELSFKVPIVGWGANVQMSDSADQRTIAFKTYLASNQGSVNTNATAVKVLYDTVTSDTHGAFDLTNKRYSIPVAGYYVFSAQLSTTGTNVLANQYQIRLYKNGNPLEILTGLFPAAAAAFSVGGVSPPILLAAGDYIEIYVYGAGNNSASNYVIQGATGNGYFSGWKVQGPTAIGATESVIAVYQSVAGTSYGNGPTTYALATKIKDTHNAFASNTFTAPVSGSYMVSFHGTYSLNAVVPDFLAIYAVQAGSVSKNWSIANLITSSASSVNHWGLSGTVIIPMVAGDTLILKMQTNQTNNATEYTTLPAAEPTLSIVRVGF